MSLIYMQSTIENFIEKNRINEVTGDMETIELEDDKGNLINKYYKLKI